MNKILFVSTNGGYGGSEVLWINVMSELKNRGMDVCCLINFWERLPEKLLEIGADKIYQKQWLFHKGLKKIESVIKRQPRQYESVTLESIVQKNKPDLVVISVGDHSDHQLTVYCSILILLKIPYIILVQLATDYRVITDHLSLKLLDSYVNAKRNYFLCDDNKRIVETHIGHRLTNAAYFQSPFNTTQLSTPQLAYTGDNSVYSIGMVANCILFHKGHELLLEALAAPQWKARNIRVNIYGNGINLDLVKRLIAMYGLEEKVYLMGHVSNPADIWKNNHACIFVSRMEGQSLAMLDAMSMGRMVIATDVGDAVNLIKDKVSGFIIPYPKASSILHILEEAWLRREDWLNMGVYSKEVLKQVFREDPVISFCEELTQYVAGE